MYSMISTLSWNISGIASQGTADRLKYIKQQYNLPFIFLQEPMVRAGKIERYKRKLGFQYCFYN